MPDSLMNLDASILNKIVTNLFQQQIKKSIHHDQLIFSPRDANDFQHVQIIKCNTTYQQKQKQKPHDHFNRHRKRLQQNSKSFHDHNSDETRTRRNVPQHSKGYI
jgi:hypothetical protein